MFIGETMSTFKAIFVFMTITGVSVHGGQGSCSKGRAFVAIEGT